MSLNYCGRSCDGCELQTELNCKGCKNGPGGYDNICELASCCTNKVQTSCEECIAKDGCEKIDSHKSVPDYIRNSLSSNIEKIKRIKERAKYADKFRILYIIAIVNIIVSILTETSISEYVPIIGMVGNIASIACSIISMIVLFDLGKVVEEYKISAYCNIAVIGIAIITIIISVISMFGNSSVGSVFGIILMLIALGVQLFGTYKKYQGHHEILSGIDDELAEKWEVLWNMLLIGGGGCIAGLICLFIATLLGVIVMLAACVVLIIYIVNEIKYLKKMYELFEYLDYKYKDATIND